MTATMTATTTARSRQGGDAPIVSHMISPLMAAFLAIVFGAVAMGTGRRAAWVAAIAWGGYAVYEWMMKLRILCTGECNIRVDLLLIYPVLLVISLVGVVSALRRTRVKDQGSRGIS
jgi:hypothetical protein